MAKVLEFYNVKTKKRFKTENYRITSRMVKGNKRKYAVAAKSASRPFEVWLPLPNN